MAEQNIVSASWQQIPRSLQEDTCFGVGWEVGRPGGVSGAHAATPGARIWLKTRVKVCLISPVKVPITNKHGWGFGQFSRVMMQEQI